MWARLSYPRHSAQLLKQRLLKSVLLDSEPPEELAFVAAPVRHKETPQRPLRRACQGQTEPTSLDCASSSLFSADL